MIKENLENIKADIELAKKGSAYGQNVLLVAVSKTKPVSDIQEAYDAGQRDFGENKVQELTEKYDKLPSDIRWHLIGHLQTNKVKYIIDKVYLIHSVDSIRLAEEIEKQAEKKNVTANILIQVNISEEESKSGINKDEAIEVITEILKMPHIKIKGFMTIAPETSEPEKIRWVFSELRKLYVDINRVFYDNIDADVLSMGMSGDFKVAIEEGSTMVRIGSSIFGKRNYNISPDKEILWES